MKPFKLLSILLAIVMIMSLTAGAAMAMGMGGGGMAGGMIGSMNFSWREYGD